MTSETRFKKIQREIDKLHIFLQSTRMHPELMDRDRIILASTPPRTTSCICEILEDIDVNPLENSLSSE